MITILFYFFFDYLSSAIFGFKVRHWVYHAAWALQWQEPLGSCRWTTGTSRSILLMLCRGDLFIQKINLGSHAIKYLPLSLVLFIGPVHFVYPVITWKSSAGLQSDSHYISKVVLPIVVLHGESLTNGQFSKILGSL